MTNQQQIEEHLLKIIRRWSECGTFVTSPDGHLFFRPCEAITSLRGALDMKKESAAVGARIILREVKFRPKHSRYSKFPWFQVYVLPVVEKTADTMTAAESANMNLNIRAMRLAHAVERDPEQAAAYHQLHEAHIAEHQAHPSCPPAGYKKFYPSFYGFVYATIRQRLAAECPVPALSECPVPALAECPVLATFGSEPSPSIIPESHSGAPLLLSIAPESHSSAPSPLSIAPASNAGITLCVPSSSARRISCASIRLFSFSSYARSTSYASYRHCNRPRAA